MTRLLLGRLAARHALGHHHVRITPVPRRLFTNASNYDALVLGSYTDAEQITFSASRDITSSTRQTLVEQLAASGFKKEGDVRVLYNVGGVKQVAVVSLGKQGKDEATQLEQARKAVSGWAYQTNEEDDDDDDDG